MMYTVEDIRDIAVQIERNGEQTYRSTAQKARNPELAKVLIWLADQEQRHAQWFEKMNIGPEREVSEAHRELEAMGRTLLREMVQEQPFSLRSEDLDSAGDVSDIIAHAMNLEHDTIVFYDMLQDLVEDDKANAQLDLIINEEREHLRVLENLSGKSKA